MAGQDLSKGQPSARRGRPRNFDRDEALGQALTVFQANGYEGTSMAQLVDAMGIVSPSIYAAFGSKEDLFREAVDLYLNTVIEPVWIKLDDIGDVRLAVQTMLFDSIDMFAPTGVQHGCLVMLGTGHLGGADGGIRAFLTGQRQHFKTRLAARFRRALVDGHLSPETDPLVLADCVLAFFGGLAIASVDGASGSALRKSAHLFCDRLLK